MEQRNDSMSLTPEPIVQMLQGYWASAIVKAGIDLAIFTHVTEGRRTVEALARAIGAPPRGTRIFLNGLLALQLLAKDGEEYHLTPLAEAFLVRGREGYIGDVAAIMTHPILWQAMVRLSEAVRQGGTILEQHAETPAHPFWETFSVASRSLAQQGAEVIAELLGVRPGNAQGLEVLDIACGSGLYGFVLAQRDREARITCVDWENVLPIARRYAETLGLSNRVRFLPGDIFEVEYGSGYDVAILSHVYHHFSQEKASALTRKVYAALREGGRIAIHDFVPDEERAARPFPLLFAVLMLVWTRQGDTYTFAEYRTLLEEAGFRRIILHEPAELLSQIIVAEK